MGTHLCNEQQLNFPQVFGVVFSYLNNADRTLICNFVNIVANCD